MAEEVVRFLKESLPYIKKFQGKTFVIKVSGKILDDELLLGRIAEDIALLDALGIKVAIVHGAGTQIDREVANAGVEKKLVNGLRYTDAKTLAVVKNVLKLMNKRISVALKKSGAMPFLIDNTSRTVIYAVKKAGATDYGLVGTPKKIDALFIKALMVKGFVPVISCLGKNLSGQSLNINADEAALHVAMSLKAEKLFIVSDVPGILLDKNDKSTLVSELSADEAKKLIEKGIIDSGMIPKTLACIRALNSGIKSTHLVDGREHSILLEVFTDGGKGTKIRK